MPGELRAFPEIPGTGGDGRPPGRANTSSGIEGCPGAALRVLAERAVTRLHGGEASPVAERPRWQSASTTKTRRPVPRPRHPPDRPT